jgi:hypothetical protein
MEESDRISKNIKLRNQHNASSVSYLFKIGGNSDDFLRV